MRKTFSLAPLLVINLILLTFLAQCNTTSTTQQESLQQESIRAEIDKILLLQEQAYDQHTEEGRMRLASTCEDSLLFVGGDNGGFATSSNYYVHDLADGYSKRPTTKVYRIYEHTVIVTAQQQTFKVFNRDTIYFNSRYTKVFVRKGKEWKMAFVTYAPLPIHYIKPHSSNSSLVKDYAGLYQSGPSEVDTVTVVDGKVFLNAGTDRSEQIPINDSTFYGEGYFGKTVFVRNAQGKVTHNYFEFPDGQRILFPKIK